MAKIVNKKSKQVAAKKQQATKVVSKKKVSGVFVGRLSTLASQRIVPLVKTNDRREGTLGWKSMALILKSGKKGITVADYVKAGHALKHARWDAEYDRVKFIK